MKDRLNSIINEQSYSMDIRIAPVSWKCVIAIHVFAIEQSDHRWDKEEDCYVLNICPHWRGKSAKEKDRDIVIFIIVTLFKHAIYLLANY